MIPFRFPLNTDMMADTSLVAESITGQPLLRMLRLTIVSVALVTFAGMTFPGAVEARRIAIPTLITEGENLVRRGQVAQSVALYAEAQVLSTYLDIPAGAWNTLCWFGSLWDKAPQVIDACDKAVEMAPEVEEFRDSRGLARALVGDIDGAIEDFQVFIEATDDLTRKFQRQAWINDLRRGQNPFTPAELKQLFQE